MEVVSVGKELICILQEREFNSQRKDLFDSIRSIGLSNLVRRSVLTSSGFSPFPIVVAGIEPWSSLPSPASITTEPTND
ncbi:hypothetical protein A2U01_0053825 [Trifolium medium]|uniref:Uncharacterized protein n=1 Tax=Trifolium medium TaxID=97028 RepID=A0A392R7R4_9FABA|nr:hypothetical protein [Trifolium medium]